ncbi:NPCBM/NEW2 domain-containing protein [Bremerella cremea]|uniref:NPCBM/NEW2 domain-containing protein n=1 Tax=Bremerella cremea TaxID=1031537 RepID=UPI001314F0DA|nr:NPCBM/NEW2 domain-containing protein [Bremerella cremea]
MSVFRFASFVLLIGLASPCLAQSALTSQIQTIGQPERTVSLNEFPLSGQWTGPGQNIDVSQIVRFGNPGLIKEDSVVALEDGSYFAAKELRTEGVTLHAYCQLWDEMQVPLRPLRGILLRAHLDPDQTRQSLDRIHNYQGSHDRLLLSNGDYIDGTFRNLSALKVEFQVGEKSLELDRRRIEEIYFAQTSATSAPPQQGVWIGFRDGSMFLAQNIRLADDRVTLQMRSGFALRSSALENAYAYMVYLRPLGNDVRYLSDLDAIGFKTLGFLAPSWEYKKDRNILGGTLKSDGYISQKGIGLHATARLAYRVEASDARFKAKVGIDDDTDGAGSVVFKVYVSETGSQWKPVFESPIVRGGDLPVDVDVPVKGMKGIALVVEFADGADVLDHANWFDARFEPE